MKFTPIYLTVVIWFVLAVRVPICSAEQPGAEAKAKEEKIEAGLWEVAHKELTESQFGVNAECEKAIKEYIHQASPTLLREPPGKTFMAKKKLGVLIREMIREAKIINQKMIEKNTFESVKDLFCPGFPPFC